MDMFSKVRCINDLLGFCLSVAVYLNDCAGVREIVAEGEGIISRVH